ncbi:MAG: hypothetical protein JKX97_00680 [Candidatus Lindowbacteria bacterium]|nr:hypothetical protein [Candidatus Lindowbacteria bacterium]
MKKYNGMDLYSKQGVCPWDAIEVHEYKAGIDRSKLFYLQPNHANPGDELDIEQSDEEATEGDESSVSDNELIEA